MTKEERQELANQYAQTCARLGETIIAYEIAEQTIADLKDQCKAMLETLRAKPEEPNAK